ncbi:winged helix-turn-helix domain-containing protein [Dokdonella koreensis]|uniref:Transcriptional regulator, CadC family n=1 Tax=Dokdonella koreensis DS-123 TaxID=1300342 RepID=A0A160DYL0_9GAMM|nr:transcriptional regulator [Dokdonella koreensis]ANB19560.1 Transcriptional regulator, CadC family [Dokdonella koreensis DS-123]
MTPGVFRFDDCSLHVASRELYRAGERVTVPPLVFDCLVYLIQHRDRAVGRDELVAAVWGRTSVSDAAIGKTILTVRRAIGDTGETQRLLRTVPRYGFRWIAAVETDEAVPGVGAPATGDLAHVHAAIPPAESPSAGRRDAVGVVLAVALLAAAAVAWFAAGTWQPGAPVVAVPDAVDLPAHAAAVLPAEIAAAPEDDWLRLGVMDLIATRLRDGGVATLPSDNVVRLVPTGAGREAAVTAVRRVTAEGLLIAPAARRAGPNWIVRAELVDTVGASQPVEVEADTVVAAARAVADRVLERLGKRLPAAATGEPSETELLQRIDALRLARQATAARALIDAATPAAQRSLPVRMRRAQIDLDLGNSEVARQQLEALADEVSAEADPVTQARIQRSLCIALSRLGQSEAALHACDRAITLLDGQNLPSDVARANNNRGVVHLMRESYALASQDFARARVAATLAADALLVAQIDGNLSNLHALQGRYAEVIATQQRIGERFERFGMIDEYVTSLINIGTAQITLLRPLDALETSARVMAQLPRVTHAGTRLHAYLERANALDLNGRLGELRATLERTVEEAGRDGYPAEQAIARTGLARLALAQDRPAVALTLARQALAALPSPAYNPHRAAAWRAVALSLQALDRIEEAGTETRAFVAWAATSRDDSVALFARLAEAEQAVAERHPDAARAAYADALAMAERWSVPDVLREVAGGYGRFLLAQGDLPEASSVIGRVAGYADVDFESADLQRALYHALGQDGAAAAAWAQARRLAGERPLPPAPEAAVQPVAEKSSSGNGSDTPAE